MDMNYALHIGMVNLAPSFILQRQSLMDVSFVCSFWCFLVICIYLDIFDVIFLSTFLLVRSYTTGSTYYTSRYAYHHPQVGPTIVDTTGRECESRC